MIGNDVLDAGLKFLIASAERLDLCTREPSTFAEVRSSSIANTTAVKVTGPIDIDGGRQTIIQPTRGRVTGKGRPVAWALTGKGALLATGPALFDSELSPGSDFELPAVAAGLLR